MAVGMCDLGRWRVRLLQAKDQGAERPKPEQNHLQKSDQYPPPSIGITPPIEEVLFFSFDPETKI